MAEDRYTNISVGGVNYYDHCRIVTSKDEWEFSIGKSLRLRISKSSKLTKIQFKPTTILKDALIDIPFILSIAQLLQFEIGGTVISLAGMKSQFTNDRITRLHSNLDFYRRLSLLFDKLHLEKEKDISKFTTEDYKNTARLEDALFEGKQITGLRKDIPYLTLLDYADTKLALIFKPVGSPGTYEITDFFADNSYKLFRIEDEKKKLPTSKYMNLTADSFLEIGNIDYTGIIDSFACHITEPYCTEDATQLLLQMIHAYDKSKDERKDILRHAEQLARWLVEMKNDFSDSVNMTLNLFQIYKRERVLTESEENELIEIAENVVTEQLDGQLLLIHRVGAYLLLDNQTLARYCFTKLDKPIQEQFRQYPIWRFCAFEKK